MSQITKSVVQPILLAILAVQGFILQSAVVLAQEAKDVNVDVNLKTDAPAGAAWYSAWWIWVLIAVFIIVVVALTTRGGNRDA